MQVVRSVVALLGMLLVTPAVGCTSKPPPGDHAGSGSAAPVLPAAPPLRDVRALTITIAQGGPAITHCSGTVAEYTVDLEQGKWSASVCLGKAPGQPAEPGTPMTTTTGTLTAAQRTLVQTKYATLAPQPTGRGDDGGPVTLTITERNGRAFRFVDLNWRDEEPPPASLTNLRAFAAALGSGLNASP